MMTRSELIDLLTSERAASLWAEIARVETRFKGPLRSKRDPQWFLVDEIFEDLRAIPRRLSEEKTIDAEKQMQ